ncbi:MAG: hypothetical protein KatS3mg038_2262 [Candidatus Kapaibacterium sp.]|nr:MAG: hypothetical protein KatS3mg038_2262 [Candidatus Kapabacteria bacterium]
MATLVLGTTTPGATLDVSGTLNVSGNTSIGGSVVAVPNIPSQFDWGRKWVVWNANNLERRVCFWVGECECVESGGQQRDESWNELSGYDRCTAVGRGGQATPSACGLMLAAMLGLVPHPLERSFRWGTDQANTKLAIYDGGSDQYGFGIQGSQFRIHLGNSGARFSFLNAPAGTEVMTVYGSGNVGIGITSPTSRLHVGGDIRSEGHMVVSNTDNAARELRLYEPLGVRCGVHRVSSAAAGSEHHLHAAGEPDAGDDSSSGAAADRCQWESLVGEYVESWRGKCLELDGQQRDESWDELFGYNRCPATGDTGE